VLYVWRCLYSIVADGFVYSVAPFCRSCTSIASDTATVRYLPTVPTVRSALDTYPVSVEGWLCTVPLRRYVDSWRAGSKSYNQGTRTRYNLATVSCNNQGRILSIPLTSLVPRPIYFFVALNPIHHDGPLPFDTEIFTGVCALHNDAHDAVLQHT